MTTLDDADNARLLKEQLQLIGKAQAPDTGGGMRYQIKPLPRSLGFDKGFYVCLRALQLLTQHNSGCTVVGVAGASGSGKTTFTARLKTMLANIVVISLDMYNDGSKVVEDNFDDPRICDFDTLLRNIAELRAGRATQVPVYDFRQSKRVGYEELQVPASNIIVLEGIHALSERLEPLLDLRIAITGGVHLDLVKRVMRDITRSGQEPGEVLQQVTDTVFPMYKAFIEPSLRAAHIRVANSFNPFAGFKEPVQILKTEEAVTVAMAHACLRELFPGQEITQEEEIEVHDIFLLPPGEDPQGCQSWLRLRNKEGRYSLMFAEYIVDDPFIVSPRVSFEVSVKMLGGLMALGYTIGSLMSRTSFRVVAPEVCVKWDHIDKLGSFVQIQGETRHAVQRAADALGVHTFASRSYIELVQLLQLTQEFSTVTDAARARFDVGDDVIIDDHVIGTSPARRLVKRPSSSQLRHSADGAICASATDPARQALGFGETLPVLSDSSLSTDSIVAATHSSPAPPPAAQASTCSHTLRAPGSPATLGSGGSMPRQLATVPKSLLSCNADALSLQGSHEVCDAKQPAPQVVNRQRSHARLAHATSDQRLVHATSEQPASLPCSLRRPAPASVGAPRTPRRRSGELATLERPPTPMARVMAAIDAQGQQHGHSNAQHQADSTPWFWERRGDKPVDVAAVMMDLRADIKKAANELRETGGKLTRGVLIGCTASALVAGCALGVAVSTAMMRR